VPYVAADVGSLFGGWLSGFLITRGLTVNAARKIVIGFAALLMPAGIAAAFTPDPMIALVLVGVVLFGFQVWINNVQTLPSDFFPKTAVGSVAGLGGTGAGIGSMIFIFSTGWVVDNFSYTPVLVTAGLLAPIGTLVLFVLAGNIQKVHILNIKQRNNMQNYFDFTGKVVLVTGASSGIGRATAELFGRCGASVAVTYLKKQSGRRRGNCGHLVEW
jgi:ACS family hexuronate transporter-like MFS transporter